MLLLPYMPINRSTIAKEPALEYYSQYFIFSQVVYRNHYQLTDGCTGIAAQLKEADKSQT